MIKEETNRKVGYIFSKFSDSSGSLYCK